ncbi:unnamed protein product [Caenorhabditis bovis]|uniref:Spermatogenesis-associated protein 20-like TRX domain-containing protein n=1 Tax=Caenorhabditis bovis TaxID=2654633 RepID=A0A8S1F2P9_9PELO|nr:unnamed protein product [Caenorhabditis bovis]
MLSSISRLWLRNMSSKFTNRLALEKSPYLQQHKNNPIEWYPWGSEAFEQAKSKNLPIFLSVGYSTCHWCHVMEKESFENEEIAKYLNENFVSIKVDREERPDVDKMYMTFVQAVTGSGGWPMTVFLTPDLSPITGGTYFPPDDNRGMLGFPTILKMIKKEWDNDKESLIKQGKHIINLMKTEFASDDVRNTEEVFNNILTHKQKTFDGKFGGFGNAPKFPKACDLDFLINYAAAFQTENEANSKDCVRMLEATLEGMTLGGIHDHVGKGFHRYSVDAEWHVPHFEKMLYDQAQLLATYSDFHILTARKNKEFEKTIRDIVEYLKECLYHPEGGFYAAEDADSFPRHGDQKKVEGAFCVWEKDEIKNLIGDRKIGESSMFDVVCEYFDVEDGGNVPRSYDPHGELTNKNILRRLLSDEECAKNFDLTVEKLLEGIEEAKKILRDARSERPKPHLDSKIVTSWQGLTITGLSRAFVATNDETYLDLAMKCVAFVRKYLVNPETNDLRRAAYKSEDGESIEIKPIRAFSDDYAFLIQGLLDIYTLTGNQTLVEWALDLQTKMNEKFWNHEGDNGYFISEETVVPGVDARMIEDQDGAEPCATSVAANNLLRLYDITEDEKLREMANKCFRGAAERLNKVPLAVPKLAVAHRRWQCGSHTYVIVGDYNSEFVQKARKAINQKLIANSSVVHIQSKDDISAQGASHSGMAHGQMPCVYVCKNFCCSLPIRNVEKI